MDAGWAALIGALIGSITGGGITYLQIRSERIRATDQRLFDARRAAYEEAVTVISFTHNERMNGRRYPSSSQDAEAQWKTHKMVGPIMLWSSKELVDKMYALSAAFNKVIPVNPEQRLEDDKKAGKLWLDVVRKMREEVGMEDLINSISDLPTKSNDK